MPKTRKQLARKLMRIADDLREVASDLADLAAKPEKKPVRCIQCGESTKTPRRGCCPTCYQRTYQRIRRGQMTDEEAVEAGLLSPERSKGGRKPSKHTALDDYLATKGARSPEAAESLAEELVADAEELQGETRAKRGTKKTARKKGAKSR